MIYFVEDDANIRKLVCYALEKEGYEVKGFSESTAFWQEMKRERGAIPELLLLDIMLPGEDGLSILKQLRKFPQYEEIPIIMLSAKGSEFDKVTGLDLGADDYIAKPFGMTELSSRVRAVLRRYQKNRKAKEYHLGTLYVNPEKHIIQVEGEDINLSFKEYCLLMVLLEAGGKVVSRETLLNRVWGEFYDESRTLDVHIRKLRVKLKEEGKRIQTVKSIGYKMGVDNHA